MINIPEVERIAKQRRLPSCHEVLEMTQLIRELAGALDRVVAISDRKHDAWDAAKAALEKARRAGVTDHIADVRDMVGTNEQSSAVAVPDGWRPIETAPKDNKRPLLLAQFSESGELHGLDWDGSWEPESESWEIPQVYYVWVTAMNYVDEPTHWMYQPDWIAAAPKQEGV